ncbi:MAG TPA: Na/Pi cotransporter family protein [Deltaproteobacteria bacterium]|nr:Na/Pi cotransporter family protein [Deltaproteobacteria bacterium]
MQEFIIAVSGIILFLIGILRLSSSVQNLINVRIRQYVKYIVEKPLYGFFTGVLTTIMFQSSSASTALTIGLVSAGLISFSNSLAIILGTDIGTTLTVQFVIWRFTEISPLIITLGGLLWLVGKGKSKIAGEIIFYFGLIFFGLELVSKSVEPLKESHAFIEIFTKTQNPLLGMGIGIAVTGIVQASAIPISIMVLLAQQDLVSLHNAVPVIMGANIGTSVTALLAGTVATKSGKRTAISHLIFKCVGIGLCFIFLTPFVQFLQTMSSSVAQQIALAHFMLNLVIVFIFIFLLAPFAAMINKLLPGDDEILSVWPEYLNEHDMYNPQKALENVHKELQRQFNLVQKIYLNSIRMIESYQEGREKDLSYIEMVVNDIRAHIVQYLWKVSSQNLSEQLSKKIFAYTAMANDIESIGSHVLSIAKLDAQKAEKKIKFSECGENELKEIIQLVSDNFDDTVSIVQKADDKKNMDVIVREEEVDTKVKEARDNHLERFHKRLCDPEAGPIFVEMLLHLERISDLCNNVAEYMCDVSD